MLSKVVKTRAFLTLLGGGSAHFRHVSRSLERAPILICADGGADRALQMGFMPQAVIGDMDSITQTTRDRLSPDILFHIREQDSTDFEKSLQRIEARAILAHGFFGGRMDHALAACSVLLRYPEQACVLIGEEDLCFLSPLRFAIDLPARTPFSLFPMGPVQGRSQGLFYPIEGLCMAPDGQIGTSNETTGPVQLEFDRRRMLILLPVTCLDAVLASNFLPPA